MSPSRRLPFRIGLASLAVALFATTLRADTVTLAPAAGITTNAFALYTGDTAINVAGPGTVKLNPVNRHTGGTTLSGGTLVLSGDIEADLPSPVGLGTITVAGGTLRGTGTFGRDITGTGLAAIEAPGGWTWTGNNTFANTNALTDGILTIADGTTAFSKPLFICRTTDGPSGLRVTGGTVTFGERLYLGSPAPMGEGGLPASYEQTDGTVTLGGNLQLGFSNSQYGQTTFTMTGGTFNMNGVNETNIVSGYNTTYTTNTIDVSGTAKLVGAGDVYTYSGDGNRMDVNVHDGGTLGFVSLYNGHDTSGKANTNLRVDGGVLRNDNNGSSGTKLNAGWVGHSGGDRPLTSFKVGPKGLTFISRHGDASGIGQVYSPMTAEPAGEGENAAGVTVDYGRFAYYVAMDYEGPTRIKNGAWLYLSVNGQIPAASPVTVEGGGTLRLMGADKTIAALTLEEDASLAFGTPSSGANISALTVSGNLVLPTNAKISLYMKNTVDGANKNDVGTYAILKASVAYANALRAVRWTCTSLATGRMAAFSVSEEDGVATLSVTISDAPSFTEVDDITVPAGAYRQSYGALAVTNNIDVYGTLKVGSGGYSGNVTGSATGGSITVHNGGVLDVPNGEIKTSDSQFFDLYLEDGGSIFVKNIQAASTAWNSNTRECFHFNGGTIYPLYGGTAASGSYWQMILNYQYATLGEHGLTIYLSRWERPDYISPSAWVRVSIQGRINHDPDCAGLDGGILVQGCSDERLQIYFGGRMNPSTFNGDIHVKDGCIASSISYALLDKTLIMEPGTRLRPFFGDSPLSVQVGSLTLGEANATKPVALDTSNKAKPGCYVVSNAVSVLSPVELGTCANWDSNIGISAGTFTTLVYRATCSVDPTLFRLPAGKDGYSLSAEEVTIAGGDYDGWKALVCTVTAVTVPVVEPDNLVVTGSAGYPSPVTVSTDADYGNIVLGGTWGGVEDPCTDTSLTISGNVTASKALYLGYNARPGVDQYHPHQGFLTIGSGASLSVPVVYSGYRTTPIDNQQNPRYGCEVTVDGGQLNVSGDVRFGQQISKSGDKLYSQLTVDNGGRVTVGGTLYLYYYQNTANTGIPGCIVLNDGEVDVTGPVDLSRNSKVNTKTGGVHYDSILYHFGLYLNGGVLKAETIKMTQAGSIPKVYFNGGTFMPYGKSSANRTMQNLNKVYVSEGGAKVSTENLPAGATYTIAQPLLTDPALSGAADGGFTKKGAGVLALTGANTFTGPVTVEKGKLEAGSADALSSSLAVTNGAELDAVGKDLSLADVLASGTIVADSVTVSRTLTLAGEDSLLSVVGNLTLARGMAVDFAAYGDDVPRGWIPVAAASGTVTAGDPIYARNAGVKTNCATLVVDGVLYITPTCPGTILILK